MGRSATALISDTHTAEVVYTPYQRPPDAAAIRTPIPRGLLSFVVRDAVLALKPINDDELLTISFSLPGGFGFVLAECHVNIEQDRAQDWEEFAMLLMVGPQVATEGVGYRMAMEMANTANGGVEKDVRTTRVLAGTLSRVPITPGPAGTFTSWRYQNFAAAAAAAGNVSAAISFWEYDLEQLAWYPTHSAENVVTR